jgi:hypothetical protein
VSTAGRPRSRRNRHNRSVMWEPEQEEIVEPFRVTPGFIAFVSAMFVPVVIALVVVIGAWAVSGEVYAAEERESRFANSGCLNCESDEVAGWKKSLVGICPLH